MHSLKSYLFFIVITLALYSCGGPGGNDPGTEYMPDMAHSIAYEANLYDYYYYNTWDSEADYYEMAKPRLPVANTIPAGQAAMGAGDDRRAAALQGYAVNGFVPYAYADTDSDRLKAERDIITNPYPITSAGLARGKNLYEINCGICHGSKGDGEGWLYSEDNLNAKYPAAPAVLTNDTFTLASNGRLYHAIMHGKNVMGGYADKLSYEERWQVIHYIRSLQAKNKKLDYSETSNTLNKGALPYTDWVSAYKSTQHMTDAQHADHNTHEAHSDDDGGSHDHDSHDH